MVENEMKCPEKKCKSNEIRKCGFSITRDGKKQVYQCIKCGRKFVEENTRNIQLEVIKLDDGIEYDENSGEYRFYNGSAYVASEDLQLLRNLKSCLKVK